MYPQIPLEPNILPAPKYAVIFIGGFGDKYLGISKRLYDNFPGFMENRPFHKAFYHWDGQSWGLFYDNNAMIAWDISNYRKHHPDIPIVLIGHSYGASTSMEVLRKLYRIEGSLKKIILLTIDAVSRRQPKTRAKDLLFWGNSYLYEGGGIVDIIPRVGGRWGSCPDSDIDLAYSGYTKSSNGKTFSHRHPSPMIYEAPSPKNNPLSKHVIALLNQHCDT